MTRIAILDDYQGVALELADWGSLPGAPEIRVFREPFADEAAAAAALAGYEVVCAMRERTPFPRSLFEQLPQLRLLVTTGMRNLAIDLDAARDHGVTVCGTASPGHPAAELAWGLVLALSRHIVSEDTRLRAGRWQTTLGSALHGRTLGVLGLGRLGGWVAGYGKAFGMRVLAWSTNLDDARCAEVGVERAGLDALLGEADVVSIHLVLGARYRGLLGARELGLMKPTALLVNTSRGPIVDEAALVAALGAGRLGGAGLDVYAREPLAADHPLLALPNTVLTSHVGYVTEQTYRVFYGETVEAITAWLAGRPVRVLG
ncbi:MAG TPA: D-2-hydroxyacid dehydrogenase family protein [Gammaproteobacteria bacterium]